MTKFVDLSLRQIKNQKFQLHLGKISKILMYLSYSINIKIIKTKIIKNKNNNNNQIKDKNLINIHL